MNPTVSVVIPCYRAATFIGDTLRSVFAQTRPPEEVVVVDDASPDGTTDAAREVARTAPLPVRVIPLRRNTGGPAGPLNVGFEIARGTYVAPLDHDDRLLPARLAAGIECFRQFPDVGLTIGRCRADSPDESLPANCVRHADRCLDRLIGGSPSRNVRVDGRTAYAALHTDVNYAISCSSFLVPKAVWRSCGGFDESIRTACDFAFLQQVLARFDLGVVNERLFVWRRPPTSLTGTTREERLAAERLRLYARFAADRVPEPERPAAVAYMRDMIRREHNGLAYRHRQRGRLIRSLGHYARSIARCGPHEEAVLGILKLAAVRLGARAPRRGLLAGRPHSA
ncbi:MAG TPA: glycosyltransferase family 2 protein [Gemmataceae bacterium]|nr:glycosyltransferase family 2 protein [Gemmataceae bacterium]